MRRYGCFSVTGYEIVDQPNPFGPRLYRPRMFGSGPRDPITTWYVVDNHDAGRIVAVYEHEHEARQDVFRSNAEERAWEKQREHLIEDLLDA